MTDLEERTSTEPPRYNRKERQHLDLLQQRLNHLHGEHPERHGDPEYVPGEANALAWALSVLEGSIEPVEVRLERLERTLRIHGTRLSKIEHCIEEEDE